MAIRSICGACGKSADEMPGDCFCCGGGPDHCTDCKGKCVKCQGGGKCLADFQNDFLFRRPELKDRFNFLG